jgi:UDP-N-acetyl-2-amino-2-deoxyglucuronate dehydrogenase
MKTSIRSIPTGKIRFAIIGCGHIGLRHAEYILANPECTLVALCDNNPAAVLPPSLSSLPFFTDEDQLMDQDFDVLVIATPNGLHEGHAIKALRQDRHVLIEKPMALTANSCANIMNEARQASKHIFCVMQLRYSPPSALLKNLVDSGALGRIYLVTVNCFWNRDERYYKKGGWKGTSDLDGGTLFTQFSHFIDTLLWLFGDIEDISARFENFSHGDTSFEDTGTVGFAFTCGGIGSFNFTTSVNKQNLESSLTVIAEKGTVRIGGQYMDKLEICSVENRLNTGSAPEALAVNSSPTSATNARGNHAFIYDNIVSVLKKGGRPDIDPGEAARVVATIEKIYSRKKPM